jgi:siroheme synthase-like protein
MGYYATYLDLTGRSCLVVGGGSETTAKVRGLREAGAVVTVVEAASFQASDLDGCVLAIDTSGDDASGERVAAAARARGVLVNVLDRPQWCDFIAPALVRRGPLQVAISTGGRSPFMAAEVRRRLEKELGEADGELVELVGELRDRLRAQGVPLEVQQRIYKQIPSSAALDLLRQGRRDEAAAELEALAGEVAGGR